MWLTHLTLESRKRTSWLFCSAWGRGSERLGCICRAISHSSRVCQPGSHKCRNCCCKSHKTISIFHHSNIHQVIFLPQASDLLCLQTSPHALLFVFHMQNNFYVKKPIWDLALFCSVLSKYGLYSPKRGGNSHYKQLLLNTFTFVGYMSRKRFTLLHVSRKSLFSLDKDRSSLEPAEN